MAQTGATSIFVNGRLVSVPGSYSEVDASALEQVGLGATGILAVLGTAEGGTPVSAMTDEQDFIEITLPEQNRQIFRSGDLREGIALCFDASRDEDIVGAPQKIVAMKVNPATQSTSTLSSALGTVATLTSEDYGAFTQQIAYEIAGAVPGQLLSLTFEDITEAGDNIGGTAMFSLMYTEAAGVGWDTMTAQVLSSGIRANGERAELGLATHVTADIVDGETARIVAGALDAGKKVVIYGTDTGNNPQRETITAINGTQAGTATWNTVLGAVVYDSTGLVITPVAEAAGILVQENPAGTLLITIAMGQSMRGIVRGSTMFVATAALNLVADGASTAAIIVWGQISSGATVGNRTLLVSDTQPVQTSVTTWTNVDFIVLGALAAARTLTIQGPAVRTLNTVQKTLQKAADAFNARKVGADGFDFVLITGATRTEVAELDLTSTSVDIDAVVASFYADLKAVLDYYNNQSQLVDATRIAFVPQSTDIVFVVVNSTTYTWVIDGNTQTFDSDLTATAAEIQTGIVNRITRDRLTNTRVTAAAQGTLSVRVSAQTPLGFTLTEGDGNLSLAVVTPNGVGAGAAPSNTSGPTFLSGGDEGVATFQDWQDALDLLKKARINTIVPLTGDPAIHAACVAHCAFAGGIGRSERDMIVGLSALDGNSAPTNILPDKDSIKEQIIALNTRHARAMADSTDRFDTAGERQTLLPWFHACVAAGMQGGATVGTSLTHKFENSLGVRSDASWNPTEDAEEMIRAGLFFAENTNTGTRFVRNITTHLSTANIAFTEASVNQAVNFAVFEFRGAMERAVGKKGFSGTLNASKSQATATLALLVDSGAIVAFKKPSLLLRVDVLEVTADIAPVTPINFVKNTIHLSTVQLAA